MADKNVAIDITASDRTKAAFDSVKRGLGEVGSKVDAVKGVFSAFAAFAASAGITQLMTEAVAAASKAEQSSNRLDAVLRATGNTVGFTREQLDRMADSLARATTFDDEGVREAQATLIKFGNLHGETFEHALKLAADYAAFTGGDMSDAAQALGRALSDPVNGLKALQQQFGALTQTQKEAIEQAIEVGDKAEAQRIIFEKLEGSIGGTAGKMNQGIYGATKAAADSWDDMLEAMGKSGAVKMTVENSLLSISAILDAIRERLEAVNRETDRSIFFQGQLKPLPPEVTGRKPSAFPQLENVTIEDIKIRDAADAAKRAEEERLREEAAARRSKKVQEDAAKAHKKAMDDKIKSLKQHDEAIQRNNEMIEDAIAVGDKQMAANRESSLAMDQMIADFKFMNDADREATIAKNEAKLKNDEATRDQLYRNLFNERELLRFHYEQDFDALNDLNARKIIANEEYYALMGRLLQKNIEDQKKLGEKSVQQRYNEEREKALDAKLFGVITLRDAGFFSNQMGALMQTKSRKLFEVGKAGAIAETIINTYASAIGAYKALASIPFVGPALGAAAAAAAVAVGMAHVSAIKSTSFGAGGGAVGTFAANPSTGLPESPTSSGFEAPPSPLTQQGVAAQTPRNINIAFYGSGRYTQEEIRDQLVPALQEAFDAGVKVSFTNR